MAELAPGTVIGGVRIDSVAGRGGMGVVYRGTQIALNRTVALKAVRDDVADSADFRERFTQESRIAASLDHPNIVPIYSAGEDDGQLYVTMRFVEGTDLREMIRQRGRLDPRTATGIVLQVAHALDAAHQRGLVHRDVKPANILITTSGREPHAYLTDFGLSRLADSPGMTRTGTVVGTLDYMAPEQFEGRPVDGRVDVYALGCVLFQALTGGIPFPRDSEPAKMWAHLRQAPPRLSDLVPGLPAALDEVLARALAKSPADRYPTTGDFGRAAAAAVAGDTGAAAPVAWLSGARPDVAATAVGPVAGPGNAWQAPPTLVGPHPPASGPQSRPSHPSFPSRAAFPTQRSQPSFPMQPSHPMQPSFPSQPSHPSFPTRQASHPFAPPPVPRRTNRWLAWGLAGLLLVLAGGGTATYLLLRDPGGTTPVGPVGPVEPVAAASCGSRTRATAPSPASTRRAVRSGRSPSGACPPRW